MKSSSLPSWQLFLQEIKWRFFYFFFSIFCSFSIAFYFFEDILFLFTSSLSHFQEMPHISLVFTNPSEAFFSNFHLSFFISFYFAFPSLILHLFSFAKNGLFLHEKKYFRIIIFLSTLLWILSFLFTLCLFLPTVFFFFQKFHIHSHFLHLDFLAKLSELFSFILPLFWISAIFLQTPLFLHFLIQSNLISYHSFVSFRKLFYLISFVIAAILTPPEVTSQILFASLLLLFYEGNIFLAIYFST